MFAAGDESARSVAVSIHHRTDFGPTPGGPGFPRPAGRVTYSCRRAPRRHQGRIGMIELIDATKTYTQGRRVVSAVRGVSLTVVGGEFVTIMGPSGSGKSTLMHLMGALDTPTSGRALFHGRDLQSLTDTQRSLLRRDRIGFVFQAFNLLPTLTAAENVALPLLLGGANRREALRRATESLDRVGLVPRADHYPEEMSGGEMQRVAVARALVTSPDAVVCDEPTGNLDSVTSREILTLLAGLPEPGKRAVVMVTHDAAAAQYGTRIVRIRDGLLESDAPVERDLVGVVAAV
jgi:putative ABC transport system ATP-binding protein